MIIVISVVALYELALLVYEVKNHRFIVQQMQVAYPTYSEDNLRHMMLYCCGFDFLLNCVMIYNAAKTVYSHNLASFDSLGWFLLVCMATRLFICCFNL